MTRTSDEIKVDEERELEAMERARAEGLHLTAASHERRAGELMQERLQALQRERPARGESVFDATPLREERHLTLVRRLVDAVESSPLPVPHEVQKAAREVRAEMAKAGGWR